MLKSLNFRPPALPSSLTRRPLLSPLKDIGSRHAGIAMRVWWDKSDQEEVSRLGLTVQEPNIRNGNNIDREHDLPVSLHRHVDPRGRTTVLCLFADASAAVLRRIEPASHRFNLNPVYAVLPVPLVLSSKVHFTNEMPSLTLKITKKNKKDAAPAILLTRCDRANGGGWIDIDAKDAKPEDAVPREVRASALESLLCEAVAWADMIEELPLLYWPGQRACPTPTGVLSAAELAEAGIEGPGPRAFVVPRFLPYSGITPRQCEDLKALSYDLAAWLLLISPEDIIRIDTSLIASMIPEGAKTATPSLRITAVQANGLSQEVNKPLSEQYTEMFLRVLQSDMSPLPPERMISQRVSPRPRRMNSGVIKADDIAFKSARRASLKLNMHERLKLHHRFDPFLAPSHS